MAQSLKEWLGAFIATELGAVVAWNESSQKVSAVKQEPDDRFSDDGSNFRSTTSSPALTNDCKVQVLSVVSSERPVVLQLSDGFCCIRATLSERARATLETEIEEKLGVDTTGDVFSPGAVTVISTPYGVPEGHVQLSIDDIQYHYHLRKKLKKSRPIEETPEVSRLLDEIKRIRTAQYDDEEAGGEDEAESQRIQTVHGGVRRAEPPVIATQVSARKKRPVPSLAMEGFEVEGGVNLARPSAAPQVERGKPANQKQEATAGNKSAALLSLLGGPRVTPTEAVRPEQATPKPAGSTREQPTNASAEQALKGTPKQTFQHATPRQNRRIAYGRQRIPDSQRRLLDRKDSWFPPLPGHQFPFPNVPVELLTTWNAQAAPSASVMLEKATQAGAEPITSSSRPISIGSSEPEESSVVSSEESSEEEEFTSSQWPQSPPLPKRDILPPDSTVGSGSTGQQIVSPRKLPLRSPAKPQAVQPNGEVNNIPQGPKSAHVQQHPPPPKPHLRSKGGETIIRGTQYSANSEEMEMDVPRPLQDPAFLHRRRRSEHMRAAQRRDWLKENYTYKTELGPYRAEVHAHYSTAYPNDPVTRSEMLKVMMEVFPLCEQRPYDGLRRKEEAGSPSTQSRPKPAPERSLAVRRQEWFKANCVYKYDADAQNVDLAEVFQAYRSAHPHEGYPASWTTKLYDAVKAEFPELNDAPQHGIKFKPSIAASRLASGSQTSLGSSPEERQNAQLLRHESKAAQHREWLVANYAYRYDMSAQIQDIADVFGKFDTAFPGEVEADTFIDLVKTVFPRYREQPENGIKLKATPPTPTTIAQPPRGPSKEVRKTQLSSGARKEADDELPDGQQMVSASTSKPRLPSSAKPQAPSASRSETTSTSSVASEPQPSAVERRPASAFEPRMGATSRAQPTALKQHIASTRPGVRPKLEASAFAVHEDKPPQPQRVASIAPSQAHAARIRKPAPISKPVALPTTNGTNTAKQPDPPLKSSSRHGVSNLDGTHSHPDTQDTDATPQASMTVFEDFFHAWKSVQPGGAFGRPLPPGKRGRPAAARKVDILGWEV
ncbi:hypothetical protein B0A55_08003 [Friedmanniomyces simplex]|uniref:Telomere replication protein EST3 n=1 Tax=Friedmanniomyces simplex TaxID=329884 RepID=A0A4U0X7D9_9PEZI|nr:hypothetical protein B0A55_08003 [Friedmanniomyces simplex]